MRSFVPFLVACGFGLAFVSASLAASIMGTAEQPAIRRLQPVAAFSSQTDLQARQRTSLNERLTGMIKSGEGSRLTDAIAKAPASRTTLQHASRAPISASRPQATSMTTASAPRNGKTDVSTIAPPPPVRSAGYDRARGGGYRPPVLDLTNLPRIPTDDIECLTQAIYYEARNESEDGQAAVAEVVINRSRTTGYPSKICAVVYQRNTRTCQFTFTCDGSIGRGAVNMNAWARAERIARAVYVDRQQRLLPVNSVNYHANYVRPSWGRSLERVRQIGAHIFYGSPFRGARSPGSSDAPPPAPREPLFHRIEAFERAYQLAMQGGQPASPPAATDQNQGI